jgi:hypothetical protein
MKTKEIARKYDRWGFQNEWREADFQNSGRMPIVSRFLSANFGQFSPNSESTMTPPRQIRDKLTKVSQGWLSSTISRIPHNFRGLGDGISRILANRLER